MAKLVVDRWLHERRPASDLADRLVCAWRGDRDTRELTERVAAESDDRGRARVLESAVRRLTASARPVDEVALEVAARLNRPGSASVRELSRTTGLSERQLNRRCVAAFGYGPAVLARILRLRRALQLARAAEGPSHLGELAAMAGYFDQQHLAHDVRAIMGITPTKLFAVADVRSIQDTARPTRDDPAGAGGHLPTGWPGELRRGGREADVEGRGGLFRLLGGRR